MTAPLLERCFPILNAWGFKYKTNFIWDKENHVMGFYSSVRHEHLIVATKGSCTPDVKKLYDSVQSIKRTEHSRKPEKFYEIIETLSTRSAEEHANGITNDLCHCSVVSRPLTGSGWPRRARRASKAADEDAPLSVEH